MEEKYGRVKVGGTSHFGESLFSCIHVCMSVCDSVLCVCVCVCVCGVCVF